MWVRVLHECAVLRAKRPVHDDSGEGAQRQTANAARAAYRAAGFRAPECAVGFDWRVTADNVVLVDATLPTDAELLRNLEEAATGADLVFRPLRHEEHDPEFTRRKENSPQRERVADAIMLMHIPREGADATIISMSARIISVQREDDDDDDDGDDDDAGGGVETYAHIDDDGQTRLETINPACADYVKPADRPKAQKEPQTVDAAAVVIACTHPGYVRAGSAPPHIFMNILRVPVLYVHGKPHVEQTLAPVALVADHVAGTVSDSCVVA